MSRVNKKKQLWLSLLISRYAFHVNTKGDELIYHCRASHTETWESHEMHGVVPSPIQQLPHLAAKPLLEKTIYQTH